MFCVIFFLFLECQSRRKLGVTGHESRRGFQRCPARSRSSRLVDSSKFDWTYGRRNLFKCRFPSTLLGTGSTLRPSRYSKVFPSTCVTIFPRSRPISGLLCRRTWPPALCPHVKQPAGDFWQLTWTTALQLQALSSAPWHDSRTLQMNVAKNKIIIITNWSVPEHFRGCAECVGSLFTWNSSQM